MSPFKNNSVFTETLNRAETFIQSLKQEERETSYAMIANLMTLPHPKQLVEIVDKTNRLWEVRGSTKDFWIRMFWFWHKSPFEANSKIVITNGYLKKENKTDPDEIKLAVRIKNAYEAMRIEEYKRMKKDHK